MKFTIKLSALIVLTSLMSGCGLFASNNVREQDASHVPPDRLLAYQSPDEGLVKIAVTRETGFAGGGCYFGLEIDRVLSARFDTGEVGWFFVPAGAREFAVVPDKMGKGLCGTGDAPSREKLTVEPGKPNRFAITTRIFRRPEVEPMD